MVGKILIRTTSPSSIKGLKRELSKFKANPEKEILQELVGLYREGIILMEKHGIINKEHAEKILENLRKNSLSEETMVNSVEWVIDQIQASEVMNDEIREFLEKVKATLNKKENQSGF